MTLRIVLVDDQEMYRLGVRMLLEDQKGVELVGEAGDGKAALALLDDVEADVVLMDIRMPEMDGIEATRQITRNQELSTKVIVLTTFDLDEYAYEAIRAGASGFLLKNISLDELLAAIRHVCDGDAVMAPPTTRRLMERFARTPPPQRAVQTTKELTGREHEILILVARGLPNKTIAQKLSIAEGTVRVHVSRILSKLELRDRAQAVVFAYETGIISPKQP